MKHGAEHKRIGAIKKNPLFKGFFLFLPFPMIFAAWVLIVVMLFDSFIGSSAYFRVITHDGSFRPSVDLSADDPDPDPAPPPDDTVTEADPFPVIYYEEQWATMNVDGWEKKDIKVFFGDNNALLRKGAGMSINSRFCGQGGKIVLSAHVTTDFHELEVTPIGTRITMDTTYGTYVYEVVDTLIFNYKDDSALWPDDSEEILFMYTCYPRKNGYRFKTERMALICKKVEGKDWVTDE